MPDGTRTTTALFAIGKISPEQETFVRRLAGDLGLEHWPIWSSYWTTESRPVMCWASPDLLGSWAKDAALVHPARIALPSGMILEFDAPN